jgi:histidinol dehydrogenase
MVARGSASSTSWPSELLLIADDTTDPRLAAADLLAQGEHDPDARLWLVTVGDGVAGRIVHHLRRLARLLPPASPNRRAVDAALARMDMIPCGTVEEACSAADRIAPEHLSIQIRAPRRALRRLRNFGSLFLGGYSAVALGDYVTGPKHILPTAGAARSAGGLSVHSFLKVVTVQTVSARGACRLAGAARHLARLEGLEAHAASLARYLDGDRP